MAYGYKSNTMRNSRQRMTKWTKHLRMMDLRQGKEKLKVYSRDNRQCQRVK